MATDSPLAYFSYSRDDSGFALRLAQDLKAAGANVWVDCLDINPGARWDEAVEKALDSSLIVLVILSPASVKSRNVQEEVSFALSEEKKVIPLLYRDCEVPLRLRRIQPADFRTDYSGGLEVLLRFLGVGQAGVAQLAAQADAERKRKEQAEATRLVAEEESKQKEQAAAARLAAEGERKRKEQAEAQRLAALAEVELKQAAAQARPERGRQHTDEQDKLGKVFISHIEEEESVAAEIASGLEAAGYSAWYYERDSYPGADYLDQVSNAIENCRVVLVLISPKSVNSTQVEDEVKWAREQRKHFLPVLHRMSWAEFQECKPRWRMALGIAAGIAIPQGGVSAILPRVLKGLERLDI